MRESTTSSVKVLTPFYHVEIVERINTIVEMAWTQGAWWTRDIAPLAVIAMPLELGYLFKMDKSLFRHVHKVGSSTTVLPP